MRCEPTVLVDDEHRPFGRGCLANDADELTVGSAKRISSPVAGDAGGAPVVDAAGELDEAEVPIVVDAAAAVVAAPAAVVAVASSSSAHPASRRGRGTGHPHQAEPAKRFPTRQQTLPAVEGDLVDDVVLECHRETLRQRVARRPVAHRSAPAITSDHVTRLLVRDCDAGGSFERRTA